MTNQEVAARIIRELGIDPVLVNEGELAHEQIELANFDLKEKFRENLILDMAPALLERSQFAESYRTDQWGIRQYSLKAETLVFHPAQFLAFVEMYGQTMIERGKLQALPRQMGLVTQ